MSPIMLSPPWFTFANQIKYTYGLSPFVHVSNLVECEGNYILNIKVIKNAIAPALRAVLPVSKNFNNVQVFINVYDYYGNLVEPSNHIFTAETLAKTFCLALYKNPLFVGTVLTAGKFPPNFPNTIGDVVIVIKNHVVLFYNDDISDLCSNYSEVAAKVFYDVSNTAFMPNLTISFTTYDPKCQLQKDLFCTNSMPCRC